MPKKTFIILFFISNTLVSQTYWQQFKKLSTPKVTWVIFHPFKAKKALQLSKVANKVTDSIRKTSLLDGDPSGGQVDAFRHAFWMAILKQEIGNSAAKSLGKAHEKENYKTYKKRKLEDGVIPDKISSEMDLFNNNIGLSLIKKGAKISRKSIVYKVINAIHQGKLKVLKKNKKGRFLTCTNTIISKESLYGKWENNKCLVDSNYQK